MNRELDGRATPVPGARTRSSPPESAFAKAGRGDQRTASPPGRAGSWRAWSGAFPRETPTGDAATVFLDGGIRHGSDIVKAVAMGAGAMLIGRTTLCGLAVADQARAHKTLWLLAVQFEKTMGYIGCRTIAEFGAPAIARGLGTEEVGWRQQS